MLVRLRIDVPVGHQQVLPAVVVVVDERVAPTEKGNRNLGDAQLVADVGQVAVALVAVERLVVVGEGGVEDVGQLPLFW
jgi:hypothetical protein